MKANLIVAEIDPSRIDVACRAVAHELIPHFKEQPGAGSGYWMVNRSTGEVLVMTTWGDEEALGAVRAADRSHRANVAERTGLWIRVIHTMDVLSLEDVGLTLTPAARWVRAMWVERSDRRDALSEKHAEAVADQQRSPGFCGSCRLSDAATGAEFALSFWDGPAELHETRADNPHHQRGLQHELDFTVSGVGEFESIAVAAPARLDLIRTTTSAPRDGSAPTRTTA